MQLDINIRARFLTGPTCAHVLIITAYYLETSYSLAVGCGLSQACNLPAAVNH